MELGVGNDEVTNGFGLPLKSAQALALHGFQISVVVHSITPPFPDGALACRKFRETRAQVPYLIGQRTGVATRVGLPGMRNSQNPSRTMTSGGDAWPDAN
jgi:hypothetical protein